MFACALKPLPEGAKITKNRRGDYVAEWTDGKGRTRNAPVSKDGTQIILQRPYWYIDYEAADGWKTGVKGETDREATLEMARRLQRDAERTKAGLASGMLSMSRMVGGTFGVAALGALVAAVGRSDLEQSLPQVSAPVRERMVDGLGSGAGLQDASAHVQGAVNHAFVDALATGLTVSAAAALVGALLAWALIRNNRPSAPAEQEAAPAVEAVAA